MSASPLSIRLFSNVFTKTSFFHIDGLFDRNPSQEARVADLLYFCDASPNKLLIKHWSSQWSERHQGSYVDAFFPLTPHINGELGQCHGCYCSPFYSGHNVSTHCGLNKIVHILTNILKCIFVFKIIFSLSNRQEVSIAAGNALGTNRRKAFIWTNVDPYLKTYLA